MPDPFKMALAGSTAGAVCAVILLLFGWPWRAPSGKRLGVGWALGIGLGFYAGCAVLGIRPKWPPVIDLDWFMTVLVPAAVLVEIVAALTPAWLGWLLRALLAVAVTPILLGQTSYLAVKDEVPAAWSNQEAATVIGGIAAFLIVVWILLDRLQARTSPKTVATTLCLTCAVAGFATMAWGYLSGGKPGFVLAGALGGGVVASFLIATPSKLPAPGVSLVAVFAIVMMGRYNTPLPDPLALAILAAPVLAWLPELPGIRRLDVRLRVILRLLLVLIPLGYAGYVTVKERVQEADDYSNMGY